MDEYQGKWALVTGASAGLGAEFARQLAARGCHVIVTARRQERLEALAAELQDQGVQTVIIPADLASPEAPGAIMAALRQKQISPDILVNSAGFGLTGEYTDRSWAEQGDFLQLMVTACAALAHHCLPGMRERGWGRVINVSSVAGLVPPSAGHTLYGASKAFLVSFTQSLAAETARDGIGCCVVCPGFTYTEFHDVNGTREALNRAMPDWMMLHADDVAAGTLKAADRGHTVHVPGWQYKTIVALARIMPLWLAEKIARAQQGRYRKT
ncbi:SDR family NAD(P)-dependent oxidoreductase [Aquisalinus flavus]|uniref:Dehydrogenase n=1 Tax=Aquisalinus flavus TaxID=1526572 RepID=A0A8J2V3F9_9PROT|nr:SDR family oxidoreductase [Aquisalinus flavus]MBD0425507.1 SDR family oxidoreductase [Aquisalinus flavus]UNE48862.1 SDR family oxidoreductase [Aquisalinus flavus]GGD15537.1 dehydrogenase [Aquisalinus flavus]